MEASAGSIRHKARAGRERPLGKLWTCSAPQSVSRGCSCSQREVSTMTCAEDLRLRQAYEKALRDWNSSRSNALRGVRSTETSSAFRRQILTARLKAANDLYDHSIKCAECKMSKVGLFKDQGSSPTSCPYKFTSDAGRREPSPPSRSPSAGKPNSTQEPISLQLSTISIKKRAARPPFAPTKTKP
jgi:hypothetical protein